MRIKDSTGRIEIREKQSGHADFTRALYLSRSGISNFDFSALLKRTIENFNTDCAKSRQSRSDNAERSFEAATDAAAIA